MTIILFLVDTSASMSQRTYLGARPTLLDVAKDAIEKFLKVSANCGGNFFVCFLFPPCLLARYHNRCQIIFFYLFPFLIHPVL